MGLVVNKMMAQQESNALKLVKALHSKEIEPRVHFIKEIAQLENSNQADLYKKLSEAYITLFTSEEITNLLAFYNTALGKKVLENQNKLNSDVSTIAMRWEMEQQGIPFEEIEPPTIIDGKLVDANGVVLQDFNNQEFNPVKKAKEEDFPKINNLEDLKKIVVKDPNMISDHRLLLELLGEEEFKKLFNPEPQLPQGNPN